LQAIYFLRSTCARLRRAELGIGLAKLADVSGQCFADCSVARSRADGDDAVLAKKLWEVSEKIVAGLPG
jgi:hypothetical protein